MNSLEKSQFNRFQAGNSTNLIAIALRYTGHLILIITYFLSLNHIKPLLNANISPGFQSITVPLIFMMFTLFHGVLALKHTSQYPVKDLNSYAVLPIFWCLTYCTSKSDWLLPIFQVILTAIILWKILILLQHTCQFLRTRPSPILPSWPLVLLAIAIQLPGFFWFTYHDELKGDEPYFLLITTSLIHDQDINLENNYIQHDSLKFIDRILEPQLWDTYSDGMLKSRHSRFLPLLLIPGFLAAGKWGAIFTMEIFAVLLFLLLFKTAFLLTRSIESSLTATVLMTTTAPIYIYSHRLYAEIPGALLAILSFYICLSLNRKPKIAAFLICLITAVASFLKFRFILLCASTLVIFIIVHIRTWKKILTITAIGIFFIFLILTVNTFIFGAAFIRYSIADLTRTNLHHLFTGILGQFWDIQFGVLPLNPLLLGAIAGTIPLWRNCRNKSHWFAIWIFSFLPYFFLISAYAELMGGDCPRGRFSVTWLPYLTFPLASFIHWCRNGAQRILFWILVIATLVLNAIYFSAPEFLWEAAGNGSRLLTFLSLALRTDVLSMLPSFSRPYPESIRLGVGLFCFSLVLAFGICAAASRRTRKATVGYAVPGAVLILLLSMFVVVPMQRIIAPPWMEVEDETFAHRGTQIFWEEPFKWDRAYSIDWPYICGINLIGDAEITNAVPLRGEGSGLEIIAKGLANCEEVPVLDVFVGDDSQGRLRLRSDDFDSYFIRLKNKPADGKPLRIRLAPSENCGVKKVGAVIDKLRVLPVWNEDELEIGAPCQRLPVTVGHLKITGISMPAAVKQGEPFLLELETDGKLESDEILMFRFYQKNQVLDQMVSNEEIAAHSFEVLIPEAFGCGSFEVLVWAEGKNGRIPVTGGPLFRVMNRTALGCLEIQAKAGVAAEEDKELLQQISGRKMEILSEAVHLSASSTIDLKVNSVHSVRSLRMLCNLTFVLEAIPFQTVIGRVVVVSEGTGHLYPLIIGRDIAADTSEFTGRSLKLPHPKPIVVRRTPSALQWPPALAGKIYPSLTFLCQIELEHSVNIEEIQIESTDLAGVLNIYAIGMISEE